MNPSIANVGDSLRDEAVKRVPERDGWYVLPAPRALQRFTSNGGELVQYSSAVTCPPGGVPPVSSGAEEKMEKSAPQQGELIPRPLLARPRVHSMLRASRGMKSVIAPLSYYAKSAGAANTAFAFNYALQPNLDSSWSGWQSTFDEFRVLSAELHWNVWFSTLPTGFAAQSPNAAVAYDPNDANTLTAVNQVMDYEKFQLLNVGANAAGTYAVAPQAIARGGHMVFKTGRLPEGGAQSSNVSPTLSTGQWRTTEDASNYYWGNIIGYVAQGGASSILQVEGFVRMIVEFRVRR